MAFNIEDGGLCPLPQSSIIKNAETVETLPELTLASQFFALGNILTLGNISALGNTRWNSPYCWLWKNV
jgi:hypothetical protein